MGHDHRDADRTDLAALFDALEPEIAALKRRYHLDGWAITLRVVPQAELSPRNAAEVAVREEYRSATVLLSDALVRRADRATLLAVLEHEVQHVFLHPLDALKSLVLDLVPTGSEALVVNEFGRANERVRAAIERLLAGAAPQVAPLPAVEVPAAKN